MLRGAPISAGAAAALNHAGTPLPQPALFVKGFRRVLSVWFFAARGRTGRLGRGARGNVPSHHVTVVVEDHRKPRRVGEVEYSVQAR